MDDGNLVLALLRHSDSGTFFASFDGEEEFITSPEASRNQSGVRAFVGYAGWSAGQLESEIAEKSWVIMEATPELITPVHTLDEGISRWMSIMKRLGPWHHLMAEAPDDPSLN